MPKYSSRPKFRKTPYNKKKEDPEECKDHDEEEEKEEAKSPLDPLGFGKHGQKPLNQVDTDYLEWILKTFKENPKACTQKWRTRLVHVYQEWKSRPGVTDVDKFGTLEALETQLKELAPFDPLNSKSGKSKSSIRDRFQTERSVRSRIDDLRRSNGTWFGKKMKAERQMNNLQREASLLKKLCDERGYDVNCSLHAK